MSETKHILLTGVTGFIGSHLASRLLQGGNHVSVIARGAQGVPAHERVKSALRNAGATRLDNLEVLEGDIARPGMGLSGRATKQLEDSIDEVWNSAASLSFLESDRDEIFAMNIGGTRNILELTQNTVGQRLHHISTAYICGDRTDAAMEHEIYAGQQFKNPYETSKCVAETLIAVAHRRGLVSASVYRPSVVVGHSETGNVTHFHGVYAFIRAIDGLVRRLRSRDARSGRIELPLRLAGDPCATLNLVPIDYVVDAIVELASREKLVGAAYHITNPEATENRAWLQATCDELEVDGIVLTPPSEFSCAPMNRLERTVHKQMSFHSQYLNGESQFDCSRTLTALSATDVACTRMTPERLRMLARWYVDLLHTNHHACTRNRSPAPRSDSTCDTLGERSRCMMNGRDGVLPPDRRQIGTAAHFCQPDAPATILLDAFAQHGNSPHALVSLGPDSNAWRNDDCGGVSYVQRGSVWLAAGDPIAPVSAGVKIAKAFAQAATASKHLPAFVPATEEFARNMIAEGWTCVKVGASPYFDLQAWDPKGNIAKHLRSSVNRAIKSGVTVEEVGDLHALRETVDLLCAGWLTTRLAGTSFGWLFALSPLRNGEYKRFFVARNGLGTIVGLLAASPIPIRNGWYLEDIVRSPDSPQGVCDVLVYHALRTLQAERFETATLGTVLLSDNGSDSDSGATIGCAHART